MSHTPDHAGILMVGTPLHNRAATIATERAAAMLPPCDTFRTFATSQLARDYRYQAGTGGWIFAPEAGPAILFPPHMTPTAIFHHPLARGQAGRLLSN